MSLKKKEEAKLYPCVPKAWLWLPKPIRKALAWITVVGFTLSFASPIFAAPLLFPSFWRRYPKFAITMACSYIGSFLLPLREWISFRKIGQLWYELFSFSANLSPSEIQERLQYSTNKKLILAMHPHGIIPIQAFLWAAYADQYFDGVVNGERISLYGFGAAADAVAYIPFLRNIMGFLTAGSASYKPLFNGITKGQVPMIPKGKRVAKHLFILPGGVAEIFVSKPGSDVIVFKDRRGLCKLSVETGAELVPTYVFGGTDFFNNLATGDSLFSRLSRKLKMGLTFFFGQYNLPIPFTPKVSLVLGTPIPIPSLEIEKEPIKANETEEEKEAREKRDQAKAQQKKRDVIDELHKLYMAEMERIFYLYREEAGYPNATLEIK